MLLKDGGTTVCKQMTNFKNNIEFVPSRISLIASLQRVLAGARELSSMAKQSQSHDMQKLIQRIYQNIVSIFMVIQVPSKLKFYFRTIMDGGPNIEEILIEALAFDDAPLVDYNPCANADSEARPRFREIKISGILEFEQKGVKLRHRGCFDLRPKLSKSPSCANW
jgi:hypothetical protein